MLIIQNGYECDYEMKLFYKLYFDMNEDIYVYSNFEYKDKVINVYTEIIYNGDTYFDDFYYDFDTENQKAQFKSLGVLGDYENHIYCVMYKVVLSRSGKN